MAGLRDLRVIRLVVDRYCLNCSDRLSRRFRNVLLELSLESQLKMEDQNERRIKYRKRHQEEEGVYGPRILPFLAGFRNHDVWKESP